MNVIDYWAASGISSHAVLRAWTGSRGYHIKQERVVIWMNASSHTVVRSWWWLKERRSSFSLPKLYLWSLNLVGAATRNCSSSCSSSYCCCVRLARRRRGCRFVFSRSAGSTQAVIDIKVVYLIFCLIGMKTKFVGAHVGFKNLNSVLSASSIADVNQYIQGVLKILATRNRRSPLQKKTQQEDEPAPTHEQQVGPGCQVINSYICSFLKKS